MKNIIVLLTKDCMSCESLPLYGNTYWQTPNIDALAKNGTVFRRHYTGGGSTAMAISIMLTGHYTYEFTNRKAYTNVIPSEFPSIFDTLQTNGYECHIIWDAEWMDTAWRFTREFGDDAKTIIHNLDIAQPTGRHAKDQPLVRNDALLEKTYKQIFETLNNIDLNKKQFIWIHLPHILKGRRSYMDDMDAFDNIIGFVRKMVGDDSIFISTDHGHMNLHKGKTNYGFDVYEPIIHIPLITPRIDNIPEVTYLTSHVDLPSILLKQKITKRQFIIAETAYYAQPHRKMAIVEERFKYIYNKQDKTEELYDLLWDPSENYNILKYDYYDKDRHKRIIYDEVFFYPYKNIALNEVNNFRQIKESIWRNGSLLFELYQKVRRKMSFIKSIIINLRIKRQK